MKNLICFLLCFVTLPNVIIDLKAQEDDNPYRCAPEYDNTSNGVKNLIEDPTKGANLSAYSEIVVRESRNNDDWVFVEYGYDILFENNKSISSDLPATANYTSLGQPTRACRKSDMIFECPLLDEVTLRASSWNKKQWNGAFYNPDNYFSRPTTVQWRELKGEDVKTYKFKVDPKPIITPGYGDVVVKCGEDAWPIYKPQLIQLNAGKVISKFDSKQLPDISSLSLEEIFGNGYDPINYSKNENVELEIRAIQGSKTTGWEKASSTTGFSPILFGQQINQKESCVIQYRVINTCFIGGRQPHTFPTSIFFVSVPEVPNFEKHFVISEADGSDFPACLHDRFDCSFPAVNYAPLPSNEAIVTSLRNEHGSSFSKINSIKWYHQSPSSNSLEAYMDDLFVNIFGTSEVKKIGKKVCVDHVFEGGDVTTHQNFSEASTYYSGLINFDLEVYFYDGINNTSKKITCQSKITANVTAYKGINATDNLPGPQIDFYNSMVEFAKLFGCEIIDFFYNYFPRSVFSSIDGLNGDPLELLKKHFGFDFTGFEINKANEKPFLKSGNILDFYSHIPTEMETKTDKKVNYDEHVSSEIDTYPKGNDKTIQINDLAELFVSPVPSNSTIKIHNLNPSTFVNIEVYSMTGQFVNITPTENFGQFDISQLNKGHYWLVVISKDDKRDVLRFLKN